MDDHGTIVTRMADYEAGERNMFRLAEWYQTNAATRNEATTRLQLIDHLFFECLSWSRDNTTAEERFEGQYADYTYDFPRRMLIAEAKKEGIYFELPIDKGERIQIPLAPLLRASPTLEKAVHQVGGYCQQRGVPYAVVTNGHQLLIFIGSRNDSLSPYEGSCLVFASLQVMTDHFIDLWNAISADAIETQQLHSKLLGNGRPKAPPKLASRIHGYPGTKGRNPEQASLQDVSDLVLEDLVQYAGIRATLHKRVLF